MLLAAVLATAMLSAALAQENKLLCEVGSENVKMQASTFVDRLITKLNANEATKLTSLQHELMRKKLDKLGSYIYAHPALNQPGYYVGDNPPKIDSRLKDPRRPSERGSRYKVPGRPFERVCTYDVVFATIDKTVNDHQRKVVVIQNPGARQYYFAYICSIENEECLGYDKKTWNGTCTQRMGWQYMLHKEEGAINEIWGYVEIRHHCDCKLVRKPQPFLESFSQTSKVNASFSRKKVQRLKS